VKHGDIVAKERVLWLPKGDHTAEEYEDAAFVSETGTWPLRAAVADGATESVFARDWANRLVRGAAQSEGLNADSFPQQLRDWQNAFLQQHQQQQLREGERAWYAERKAEEGAFATLLGLTVHRDRSWQAFSVGDCCLFHLRDNDVIVAWPFDDAEAFDDRPALVPSLSERDAPSPKTHSGEWKLHDAFVLTTDALAAWLLDGGTPADLFSLPPDTFQEGVEAAREEGALRDDDTTALTLKIERSR
jgi:hypothetical protein